MIEPLVTWDENYSIGEELIDNQHKNLVEEINKFYSDLNTTTGLERVECFKRMAKEMVNYVKEHFSAEESFMKSHNYPLLSDQQKRHSEFIKRLLNDCKQFENGDNLVPNRFVRYLSDWLLSHIANEDKKIGEFLKKQKQKS